MKLRWEHLRQEHIAQSTNKQAAYSLAALMDGVAISARTVTRLAAVVDAAIIHTISSQLPTEPARGVLQELLDVACRLSPHCTSTAHATCVGASLASALRAAAKLEQAPPLDTIPAEKAMADVFLRTLKPAWTAEGTPRNAMTQTNDLLLLPTLSGKTLGQTLKERYLKGVPYTYAGDVVVSVNPCHDVGNRSQDILRVYLRGDRRKLPPHIYNLADAVFTRVSKVARSRPSLAPTPCHATPSHPIPSFPPNLSSPHPTSAHPAPNPISSRFTHPSGGNGELDAH